MKINRFSIVASVYGVEKYLNDFFISVVNQTISFERHIELIVVDDGSLDNSKTIIKRWQQQYPHNIKYIYKQNGGLSSARNEGLKYVTTKWVTFIDPDDFISKNYIEEVDLFLLNNLEKDIGLISCNYIYYLEAEDRISDSHPLSYRFKNDETVLTAPNLESFFQISVNSAFFRIDIIDKNTLRMDEKVIPNFEDGHFSGRYLLSIKGKIVAFLKRPKYYYRRREDETSLMDTSWIKVEQYIDKLRFGHLGLLKFALDKEGKVPNYIQRMVLYDLIWYVKVIVNSGERISFLNEKQKNTFKLMVKEIFDHIDDDTIDLFNIAGCWFYHKVGIIGLFKKSELSFQIAYIDEFDKKNGLIKVRYFYYGDLKSETILQDEKEITPVFSKTRTHDFLDENFVNERFLWFPLDQKLKTLEFNIGSLNTRLSLNGKQYHDGLPIRAISSNFRSKVLEDNNFPLSVLSIRQLSRSPVVKELYDNAWIFMDRDTHADDNAEHLYRYVANNHPDVNKYFVLRKSSPDWKRLKKENFNLLEFDSQEHKLALLGADHLISSHVDKYVTDLMPRKWFGDLLTYSYTFLQHGVTQNDLSRWLNNKTINTLITCTLAEYSSIVEDGSRYKFSSKEVVLTGFPRHDALLKFNEKVETEKLIIIMPTWRESLVGAVIGKGNDRYTNDDFYISDFALSWKKLLHSSSLKKLSKENNYKIIFFPHSNAQQHANWFDAPDYISVLSHKDGISMQSLFSRAQLLITDYSSVAFEMAYLNKPVIYYQFDRDFVFGGGHLINRGYYNYDKDGFGPVCIKQNQVLRELASLMKNDASPDKQYLNRMNTTFKHKDGLCCQRVFERIKN